MRNQKELYNILFKAAAETLKELSVDEKHLGAKIGFISVLHTWGQNVLYHPHLHCIVPGGGLSQDNKTWVSCKNGFFIHFKVLSRLFRGKFLYYLKRSFNEGKLEFPGLINNLSSSNVFGDLCKKLYKTEWNVYSKPSFKNKDSVIKYLASYTHRVAISNQRIIKIENDLVYFRYKDYKDNNKKKIMFLTASEFIRRFLLHILPDRFVKIRYYGIFTNRSKKENLKICRELLGVSIDQGEQLKPEVKVTWQEKLLQLCGFDVKLCPNCGKGEMIHIKNILPSFKTRPP